MQNSKNRFVFLTTGILVAATGVGAGDLATATFAGTELGLMVLWAVVAGALMKFVLNEKLAHYQLVSGNRLIQGAVKELKLVFVVGFLIYLLPWTYFVSSALMGACGVAANSLFPLFSAENGQFIYGVIHSILGLILVRLGGFKLFEKIMRVCIGLMFITVIITAISFKPNLVEVFKGLAIPKLPGNSEGVQWTMALIGGVGGTLTVLSYGYWMIESGKKYTTKLVKFDLLVAYTMTAIFGIAMVVIGANLDVDGKGAKLLINLAAALEQSLHPFFKWAFLIGAWSAIFSSLLGVWESVPLIFSDFWEHSFGKKSKYIQLNIDELKSKRSYTIFQISMALIPIVALFTEFKELQKLYAVTGSLFLPILAIIIILLFAKRRDEKQKFEIKPISLLVLTITVLFFSWMSFKTISGLF